MERVKTRILKVITLLMMVAALVVSPSQVTNADVVFTPPPKPVKTSPHEYAESHFGQPPAPPRISEANRQPAGLMFEDDIGGSTYYSRKTESPGDSNYSSGADPRGKKIESTFGSAGSVANLIPDRNKGVQEVALIAGDLGYFPKTIFVTENIPVRIFITGASKSTLCIMMDSFNVRKQIRSKRIEEVSFTPKMSGKYRFYCPVNGMEGVLVVKEAVSRY